MSIEPSPMELWKRANGDNARFRELMIEHGLIVKRESGDDSSVLPCGYADTNTKSRGEQMTETIERYMFLDEVQPGMTIEVSTYKDGATTTEWMLVTGRRDSVINPFPFYSSYNDRSEPQPHINLIGHYPDGSPARTEGRPSVSVLLRETVSKTADA